MTTPAVPDRKRVLFIDEYLPMPDRNSGGCRLTEIFKLLLADQHEVSFTAHGALEGTDTSRYAQSLRQIGVHVATPVFGNGFDERWFRKTFASHEFDIVVICFYTNAMLYLDICREMFPHAKIIIDTIDLHFVREIRRAALHKLPALEQQAQQTRVDEVATYKKADALWAITPVERDFLRDEGITSEILIVPNIHEVHPFFTPYEQRTGLLFVGNFWHPPNAEGMAWFCRAVLPLVRQHLPEIITTVVGNNPPAALEEFREFGVQLAGWVPDLGPLLAGSRLSIAPLLHGAGMKGKVGEALAAGLPVVTTSIGSEGIGLEHGRHVLVGDTAETFAAAIIHAYTDESSWKTLASNGIAFMQSHFTPKGVRPALRAAMSTTAVQYAGVPDWSDPPTVKRVVDAYIRKHAGAPEVSLCLAVSPNELAMAAELLAAWITELGHNIDSIPDIDLTPMTHADLCALATTVVWIPMNASAIKPLQLQNVETF